MSCEYYWTDRASLNFLLGDKTRMRVSSKLWIYVFAFLDEKDLVSAAGLFYEWWEMIFRIRESFLMDLEWEELDPSRRGSLYRFVPLRMFTALINLNLSSTAISNRHLQQIIRVAANLDGLNISNCPGLDQSCIFQIRQDLNQLRHVDISGNPQCTVLAVACLCSCKNLQIILTYGLTLSPEEFLFLTKTFDSVSNGTLEIETEDGYDAANAMNMFAKEVFEDELLF